MTMEQNKEQAPASGSQPFQDPAGHTAEPKGTPGAATASRKRLGKILLVLGALPSALLGIGLTLGGACMIVLSIPAAGLTGLGTAFAAAFAAMMLPAGVLLLALLVLSRLSNRLLAIVGAMGNVVVGLLGIALLFTAGPSSRANSGSVVVILCGSSLIAGLSALAGHWLQHRLAARWTIGATALVLATLSACLLRDWSAGNRMQVLSGHTGSVRAVAWSPDGTMIASGADDLAVRIWNAESGELLHTLPINDGGWTIGCVAWSPDGTTIAACSGNTVSMWDADTGMLQRTLGGHADMVISLAWSPSGDQIASASNDATIIVWDMETGKSLRTLATGESGIGPEVAWSSGGDQIANGVRGGYLTLWDAATGKELQKTRILFGGTSPMAWSPDQMKLAVSEQDEVILFDTETWNQLSTCTGHKGPVHSITWSPDGKTIASGSSDQAVFLWDAATGERLQALRGHTGAVWDMAWSPDGTRLASASLDKTIVLWQVAP
jgi:WD40 repeat protein